MTPTIYFSDLDNPAWTDQERANAHLVLEFIQTLMNDHDFEGVVEKFGDGRYVQHNRTMRDGIQGVVENVRGLVKRYPGFSYDVHHVVSSGGDVVVHSHATMREKDRGKDDRGFIIFDRWRVVDGALVEHWDALQPLDVMARLFLLLSGGRVRNDNGLF